MTVDPESRIESMTAGMAKWQLTKRSKQRTPEVKDPILLQLHPAARVPSAVSGSRRRSLPSIRWVSGGLRTIPLGHRARLSRSGWKLLRR